MKLGWKVLIPVSVVWLMLVATVRALRNENYDFTDIVLYVGGAVVALLLLSFVVDMFRDAAGRQAEEAADARPTSTRWPADSPCRRCPDRTLPPVPRRRPRRERELIVSGGPDTVSDGR